MLALSIVGYLGLLDIGLGPTLVKKTAEHLAHGRSETDALSRTVSTVFCIYLVLGIVVGAAILVIGIVGEHWFKIGTELMPAFRAAVWLVGLQTAIGFPMGVATGILGGLQDFHVMNAANIAANVLRTALSIVLLLAGYGLIALIVSGFAVSLANWLFTWVWVKTRIPELTIDLREVNRSSIREVASFSWAMLLWSFAGYALHSVDRVLIGIFLPVATITTYEVGSRINQYSRNVLHSWLNTIMPAAASLHTQHETENIRALYIRATRYLLLGYVAVASGLLCFGHSFITLWVGPDFNQSAKIMLLLVASSLVQSQTVVGHVMLAATGKLRLFCTLMAVYSVVSVLVEILFVWRWGIVGAAAGVALTVVLVESAFAFSILRAFGISAISVLRRCHLPCVQSAVGPLIFGLILGRVIDIRSWPVLIATLGLYGMAMCLSLWHFGLTSEERLEVRSFTMAYFKPQVVPDET